MRLSFFSVFVVVGILLNSCVSQNLKSNLANVCITEKEKEIADLINNYRLENGLDPIPISKSLTKVAQVHAKDLSYNRPYTLNGCNMHSWSTKGSWSSCCYTKKHENKDCMWNKPKELTNYKGLGYEICFGFTETEVYAGDTIAPLAAFNAWKLSPGHNAVLINKEEWKFAEWNAIGVGINRDFVCVWFGQENDYESPPTKCLN